MQRRGLALALALTVTGLLALGLLLKPEPVRAAGGGGQALMKNGQQATIPAYYQRECADCHGDDAAGSGPDHTSMIPPPANLTLVRDAPALLASIVKKGIEGTGMHPNPEVTQAQLQQIVGFVTNVATNMQQEFAYPYTYPGREQNQAELGRQLFVTTCVACHGINGDGQTDDRTDPHIWPKPANLHARSSDIGRLYWIISYGRPGTTMPPQAPKFQSEKARLALAQYVYGLFDSRSTYTIPTGAIRTYNNPYTTKNQKVVNRGSVVTATYCGYCHGVEMAGSFLAPNLIDRSWRYGGGRDNFVFIVVRDGVYGKLMPPNANLPENDRWAAITYLRSRGGLPDPLAIPLAKEGKGT